MAGYIPKRTKEVVGTWSPEGEEPFRATIVTSLSFAEIDAIPLTSDATYEQLFPTIAPYVVAWNAMGRNAETGEYEPLPAPADAGPDVLRKVEPIVSLFLAGHLRRVHLGDPDDPKDGSGPKPSASTPAGKSASGSDSATRASRRKSRAVST